jgi:hypothetical protein
LGDHRDSGIQHVSQDQVVESDHGDPVLQAELMQRTDRTDGHEILRGEQGGGGQGGAH